MDNKNKKIVYNSQICEIFQNLGHFYSLFHTKIPHFLYWLINHKDEHDDQKKNALNLVEK
jgi:hypothetical protein